MDLSQLATVLAAGNFGGGFAAGFGAGMGAGHGATRSSMNKKIKHQLTTAIEAGEISVVDNNGESMTAESIMDLLKKQPKKKK